MTREGFEWGKQEEAGKTSNSQVGGKHLCSFRNKDWRVSNLMRELWANGSEKYIWRPGIVEEGF